LNQPPNISSASGTAASRRSLLGPLRALTSMQRRVFAACFMGWTLDALDFFILTFCLDQIGTQFHVGLTTVAESLFWTLAMRPVGALLFGLLAERIGRKPTLMINVVCFAAFEIASALSPTWPIFLLMRALFGIAMGGEWGVGAALALESLPTEGRGFFSGLLQEGYVTGNMLAAALSGLFAVGVAHFGMTGFAASWRMLFVIGACLTLLVLVLLAGVDESPAWKARHAAGRAAPGQKASIGAQFKVAVRYAPSFLFLTVLMFAFTSFSHGTQDLYPKFLSHDFQLSKPMVSLVAMCGNAGALIGGMVCGAMSERIGRRKTIVIAALLAIPMIPLWAWSHTAVMLACGGFLMQFMVQGAWGVIPVHLNELSPGPVRAVFPGVAYQLGNLLSSRNSVFQASIATHHYGGRLGPALAWTVLIVGALVALITALGPEDKGADLSTV
jgi:SHS family lactate transporter-like MFS transporter